MSTATRHYSGFCSRRRSQQRSRRRQLKAATGTTIGIITTVFTRRGMKIEVRGPPLVASAIIAPAPSPTDSVGASSK
jgi:hypothetical protein